MKMVVVFLFIMGTSMAWSVTEETMTEVLNKDSDLSVKVGAENSSVNAVDDLPQIKSILPPYKADGEKTPYLRARGNQNKQTRPAVGENTPMSTNKQSIQSMESTFQPRIETIPFNVVSAQTLPHQTEFASTGKQPHVAGQNKQQYLRGRETKPYPADQHDIFPYKQTKPTNNMNTDIYEIQFNESQDNFGFSPQILVKNPDSAILVQTLPSPIQFARNSPKQPYVAGQNMQQYLRGRQTKPIQVDQEAIESPAYILLNPIKQTKPFLSESLNTPSGETFSSAFQFDKTLKNQFPPQILVQNPSSSLFAQTLPSPIQFDQPAAKQPYISGQNKQQYLRGRQTKPFQEDSQDTETPAYILLNPIQRTEPVQFDKMPKNEFSPQILVQNPSYGSFSQTLPSPIQFDQPSAKQPYISGQNKQQNLRGRQMKPFQGDLQKIETPSYILLDPIHQTKLVHFDKMPNNEFTPQILVQNPSSGIFAQTLPGPIQFTQTVAKQPYASGQNKQQYIRGRQTKPIQEEENETPQYILLNPIRQTIPFPSDGQNIIPAETIPGKIQFSDENRAKPFLRSPPAPPLHPPTNIQYYLTPASLKSNTDKMLSLAEETLLPTRSAGSFLPGVSTRPRFPPGYTQPAGERNVQTQEVPPAGYAGPTTVLYVF